MFELLSGDVFSVEGKLLTLFKLRVGVVGDALHTYVHYTFEDKICIRTAPKFCRWLAEGLEAGTITNLNREADFSSAVG